ncbi:MAG: hypothetical protein MUQ00_07755, partial [Candidatus Aminicenantes bacterium]|nr:hypothetical protein [Candidatus Aminicenantes bacterium]
MPDLRLILESVPKEQTERVIEELMTLFTIQRPYAEQIVLSAPIILLDHLTDEQASNVASNIIWLTKLGAIVRLTAEPAPTSMRRLTWPAPPNIAVRAGNVFICPHCGGRFVVQPVGKVVLKAVTPKPATRPVAVAAAPAA